MEISELLDENSVIANLKATSKKQALQKLAEEVHRVAGLDERAVFDVRMEREKLGTTGVGNGIAIPHGKLPGLERLYGMFARVTPAIDFQAIDGNPVDLIFLLLAPESAGADHLKALARVSRLLRDKTTCEKLRGTDEAAALYGLLTNSADVQAA